MPDSLSHIPTQSETTLESVQSKENQRQGSQTKEASHPAPIARQTVAASRADTISTARSDSLASDSLKTIEVRKGIVMVDPFGSNEELPSRRDSESAVSWVIAGLILLFCIAGLRYKSNALYLRGMMRDAVEMRERGNMFDDTVRETTFMITLLLISGITLGILVYVSIPIMGFVIPESIWCLPICIGGTVAYMGVMPIIYKVWGSVFLSSQLTREWIKGFTAGIGLLSIPTFPLALIALFSAEATLFAVTTAAVCLLIVKLLFIFRSFRIFMTESSSWVLFLYYLCNLEIVPLVTTYFGITWICSAIN